MAGKEKQRLGRMNRNEQPEANFKPQPVNCIKIQQYD